MEKPADGDKKTEEKQAAEDKNKDKSQLGGSSGAVPPLNIGSKSPPAKRAESPQQPPPPLDLPAKGAPSKPAADEQVKKDSLLAPPSATEGRNSLRRTNRTSMISPRIKVSPREPIEASIGDSNRVSPSGRSGSGSESDAGSKRGSMLRRSEVRKTLELPKAVATATDEAPEERKAKKGSFRESMGMRVGKSLRESMLISASEREAALAKINALLGSTEPTTVKIECVMDGRVRKTLEVEAIDGIINGRSIQSAWNLSPEQEFHVTFMGLRAPNGDEIPFETSEEVPWLHIPFWEEVIFPDEVYEILYEDDRDVDVDSLTDDEVAALEKEFDAMDVYKQGYLTREGLTVYFKRQHEKFMREREGSLDRIMKSDLSQSRKARVGKTMRMDPVADDHIKDQVDHILSMDVVGSGKIELHEYARCVAPDIIMMRQKKGSRASNRSKRLSQRLSGVPAGFDPSKMK